MRIKNKKSIIVGLGIIVVLAVVGTVGALNGWFGGGGTISSDTFTRGLVGYWGFDEGSGTTAYDGSGNSNTGTLTNSPKWTGGKVGGALQFDGVNDYVNCGTGSSLGITGSLTLEAWFYPTNDSITTVQPLVSKLDNADRAYSLRFYSSSVGTWKYQFVIEGNNETKNLIPATTATNLNQWNHIVGVFDASAKYMYVYVNGVLNLSDSTTNTSINTTVAPVRIGAESMGTGSGEYKFNGLIDEVRIYNRALTDAEVKFHYNRGGPVAYWAFDEGSGTTAYDSTDNNNDGTLTSGATWATGKNGTALSLDGTDDYVLVSDSNSLDFTQAMTLEAWVKHDCPTSGANSLGPIIERNVYAGDDNGDYIFQIKDGNYLRLLMRNGGAWDINLTSSNTVSRNTWHYVVATWDGTTAKLFIDGIQDSTTDTMSASFPTSARPVRLGWSESTPGGSEWRYKGLIDDARIYNYARTPDEIRLDYNAGFAAHFGSSSSCDDDPGACMDYGLVGNWGFDEGSGTTAYDKSDYANTGTLYNSPKWVAGKVGGGLSFDGKDDAVSVSDNNSIEPTKITIEGWIYPKQTKEQTIVVKRNEYYLRLGPSNQLSLYFYGLSSPGYHSSNGAVSLNQWSHIIVTVDGSQIKMYINGILDNTVNSTGDIFTVSTYELGIGATKAVTGFETFFNGLIDEVRIYNRALSATEVRYHYNRGGPVGYWKFDEGSGTTAYDSTDNNNDGTLGGGTADYRPTWTTGKNGNALSFDGTNDYVGVTHNSVFNSGYFTVSAWYKSTASDPSLWQRIIGKGPDATEAFALWINPTSDLAGVNAQISGSQIGPYGTSDVADQQWHFITGTYDGSVLKIYVDGKLEGSTAVSGTVTTNSNDVLIGKDPSGYYSNGLIDDVRVYNYARTLDEIALDYNAGFTAHFGPSSSCDDDPGACMDYGLVGNWGFDEGSGTTAYDKSDYANTGTLYNSPKWVAGKVGGALQFDGKNDYVDCGTNASLTSNLPAFTVTVWVKTTSGGYDVVSWDLHGTSTPIVGIYPGGSRISIYLGGNNVRQFTPPYSIVDNQWHFLAYTVPGTAQTDITLSKAYIDGIECSIESTTSTGTQSSKVRFKISGGDAADWFYTGSIDDVRIYNRVLSATEIRYLYNRGGPVGYWKFDEGSGDAAYDESNNSNDGTLGGDDACPSYTGDNNCPTWTSGKYGSGLSFDGTDDYVDIPDATSLRFGANPFSMELWFKQTTEKSFHEIFRQKALVTAFGYFHFVVDKTNSRMYLESRSSVDDAYFNVMYSSYTPGLNWTHLTVVRETSTSWRMYINGVSVATGTSGAGHEVNFAGWQFGKQLYNGYWNGLIDDVHIYNYARTVEQIYQDYNAGLSTHFK